MDEIEEKVRILLKNKSHILRMPNNKKKVEMVRAYFSLLGYYSMVTGEDEFDEVINLDDDFIEKYYEYVAKDTKKNIDAVAANAPKLYEKFSEILDTYKDNDFCKYAYIGGSKINKSKMENALWNFFSSLGDDVLAIYCNMALSGNIYSTNYLMDRLGYSMDAAPIDKGCIAVQNIPYYIDFYTTLAHEVGHCYQFYLQKNQRNCAMFDPYCEITSLLFEKLFIEYLKNNYVVKDTSLLELENHLGFVNNLSVSKTICKLFKDDKIGVINPYSLSYTCMFKKEEVEKMIHDDCGYVEPFHTDPELIEIHYSFGDIIARHFIEKLKNDFDTEWNNYKDFICTINYLPMKEVIDKYFDLDLVKDDVKKLTKSYRER